MSKTRYCRKCKKYTLQEKVIHNQCNGFCYKVSITAAEALNEQIWKCNKCNNESNI